MAALLRFLRCEPTNELPDDWDVLESDNDDLMDGILTSSTGSAYTKRGTQPNRRESWDDEFLPD